LRNRRRAFGFTLIEMLTTVAVLTIVLGLMVSLARYVRDRSAHEITRALLNDLDLLIAQYSENNGGRLPVVPALLPSEAFTLEIDDPVLTEAALNNNREFVRALRLDYQSRLISREVDFDPFEQHPPSVYDHVTLRDAWGSPLVYMSGYHRLVGQAPSRVGQDQCFVFSAGPDRKYLTRDDNLYSYETIDPRR
jgi:prepilin-type N-terminal cleavage/methylation domain-containing protein